MKKAILFIFFFARWALVEPHGYVKNPLSRTSIFRGPDRHGQVVPFWWNDTGVWCGNVNQDLQYSQCGRCGDAPGNDFANQGGRYDKAVVTGIYSSGQRIRIEVDVTAAHWGFFEFELCPQENETDNCFRRLPILSGSQPLRDGTLCVGNVNRIITADVQLPAGVRCQRCTLRWTYRTSYGAIQGSGNWDPCFNPTPAQTFRNCVDIRIL